MIGGPSVGGRSAGPGHPEVMVQAAQTLHHVEEDVVAVAGEQLLDQCQVLSGLEEQHQPIVPPSSLQTVPNLLNK